MYCQLRPKPTSAGDSIKPQHRWNGLTQGVEPVLKCLVFQQPTARAGVLRPEGGVVVLVVLDIGGPQPTSHLSKAPSLFCFCNSLKLPVAESLLVLGRFDLRQGGLADNQVAMPLDAAD